MVRKSMQEAVSRQMAVSLLARGPVGKVKWIRIVWGMSGTGTQMESSRVVALNTSGRGCGLVTR